MNANSIKSTAKWIAGVAATLMSAWCMMHDRTPRSLPETLELPRGTGWHSQPAEVDRVRRSLPDPHFASTPAGRAEPIEGDIFLWKAAVAVAGRTLPTRDQGEVGACVAFATASAIEHLLCVRIASQPANDPDRREYRDLAPEVIYGGSRVQVGGGRIAGDGSVGAWAADFCRRWGVVPRADYERSGLDLTQYRESTCRELGRRGVPDELLTLAKRCPVRSVAQVGTASEAKRALRQGYPLIVCSDRGFVLERDGDGFCRPSGRWNHAMAILGWRGGTRPGFFILNSWGESVYSGPTGAGDAPKGGFWADERTTDAMLAQGDSWAFSDAVGFPARRLNALDWFVQTHPEERLARAKR